MNTHQLKEWFYILEKKGFGFHLNKAQRIMDKFVANDAELNEEKRKIYLESAIDEIHRISIAPFLGKELSDSHHNHAFLKVMQCLIYSKVIFVENNQCLFR